MVKGSKVVKLASCDRCHAAPLVPSAQTDKCHASLVLTSCEPDPWVLPVDLGS